MDKLTVAVILVLGIATAGIIGHMAARGTQTRPVHNVEIWEYVDWQGRRRTIKVRRVVE